MALKDRINWLKKTYHTALEAAAEGNTDHNSTPEGYEARSRTRNIAKRNYDFIRLV